MKCKVMKKEVAKTGNKLCENGGGSKVAGPRWDLEWQDQDENGTDSCRTGLERVRQQWEWDRTDSDILVLGKTLFLTGGVCCVYRATIHTCCYKEKIDCTWTQKKVCHSCQVSLDQTRRSCHRRHSLAINSGTWCICLTTISCTIGQSGWDSSIADCLHQLLLLLTNSVEVHYQWDWTVKSCNSVLNYVVTL